MPSLPHLTPTVPVTVEATPTPPPLGARAGATAPFQPLFGAPPEEPPPAPLPRTSRWGFVVAAAFVLALGAAALAYMSAPHREPVAPRPAPTPSLQAKAATQIATPSAIPTPPAVESAPSAPSDELGPGDDVPSGYGLIVVTAPSGARVRLDGAIAGTGPVASAVAAPGYHDVRVEREGKEAVQVVEVRAGKAMRLSPTPAP